MLLKELMMELRILPNKTKVMEELIVDHNAGFFSCCSVRLSKIIEFFNINERLPYTMDCSKQFLSYKNNPNEDINDIFFNILNSYDIVYTRKIDYHWDHQFLPYSNLDFTNITPFITKYFNISENIKDLILKIEQVYNINYENTVAVLYRGNDKSTETQIGSYEEYFNKAQEINERFSDIRFFIQTDEIEFRDMFKKRFKNSFYIHELPAINSNRSLVIHNVINQSHRKNFASLFLAATICISRCSAIITHSGNCGVWSTLFRGNAKNVYQYINHGDVKGWL